MQLTNDTLTNREIVSCWRLGEQLTGGRWYDIYRAAPKTYSFDSNHDFIIKLIHTNLDYDQRCLAIDRMAREAQATEQLNHPNIIRLLDAGLDQAPFFLVQPWIEGRSLDRLISQAPHLSLSRVLWVIRQIAEGIKAGHEKGRAFLGLDPSHVMVGKTGRITLIGWSHSHAFRDKVSIISNSHQLARYTAPECFSNEYRVQPSSDVYSLGVLIHQIFSIQPPFAGESIPQIRQSHRDLIPEDLIFSQPDCPQALGRLVKQMLSKNPEVRPTMREVLNSLIGVEIEHLSDLTPIVL
ncbi:MAG: serine/threonine-protein kinase [Planctomycetota bacterium]